jgi:SpoVK/Ycf46/Vps4 family AAA+-type ATPase
MSKQCHKCGEECKNGTQFCNACGAPLGEPAVTHKELADYLAEEIILNYKARRKAVGKAALFLVENRFDTFEHRVTQALAEALEYSDTLPLDDEDSTPEEIGFVFFWTYLDSLTKEHGSVAVYEAVVSLINLGRDVLIVCDRKELVDWMLSEIAAAEISVPRFDPNTLVGACQKFFSKKDIPDEDDLLWARYVTPEDFLINSEVKDNPLRHIRESVMHRMDKHRCTDARELDALYAFGDARDWAKDWSTDVREILSGTGKLGWSDVEHGALLVGPHGMGKKQFARSLVKAAGINLLEAVMPAEDSDEKMDYLYAKWHEAKSLSPCVLLIEGGYKKIGALDFMFDEFDMVEPVFVLVTHLDDDVTPALLRSGRLERVFEIPLPTARILKEVFSPLVKAVGCELSEKDLDELSRNSQGNVRTLSRAEEVVRLAQRAARRKGRVMCLQDLMDQIYETPGPSKRVLPVRTIEDTAFHESGHAVMMLLSSRAMKSITYLSVVPKGNYLGVTRSYQDDAEPDEVRNDLIEYIRMLLGGRAAEEIKNGKDGISTGPSSDLEKATWTATVMATRFGFGARQTLVSWEPDLSRNDALREEVGTLLDEQYQVTLAMLREHWVLVEHLVAAVMEKEEITGDEMRMIYEQYQSSLSAKA